MIELLGAIFFFFLNQPLVRRRCFHMKAAEGNWAFYKKKKPHLKFRQRFERK